MSADLQNWPTAPPDEATHDAWERIARLAREHCLIVDGSGGVLVIATPEAQREHGRRNGVLRAHCRREVDGTVPAREHEVVGADGSRAVMVEDGGGLPPSVPDASGEVAG